MEPHHPERKGTYGSQWDTCDHIVKETAPPPQTHTCTHIVKATDPECDLRCDMGYAHDFFFTKW